MFRGIETSEGAAVQGSIDYAHETGFYATAWDSNIDETLGSTELDVYGGWTGDMTLDEIEFAPSTRDESPKFVVTLTKGFDF